MSRRDNHSVSFWRDTVRDRSEAGMTLAETLLAVGMTGILAIAIASVISALGQMQKKSHATTAIEADGQTMLAYIRRDLGQLQPGVALTACANASCWLTLTNNRAVLYSSYCRHLTTATFTRAPTLVPSYCFDCSADLATFRITKYNQVGGSWIVTSTKDIAGIADQGLARGASACFKVTSNIMTVDANFVANYTKGAQLQNFRSQVMLPLTNSANVSFYK